MEEFSPPQRLFLTAVCTYFHASGDWPTYGWLDHELIAHDDFDVEDVGRSLEQFMFDSPFAPMVNWDPKRVTFLSVLALQRCQAVGICPELSEDLDSFVQALLLCIRKYRAGDDPVQITAEELRGLFQMPELMLRKVFRLLQLSSIYGGSGDNLADALEPVYWTFTASPNIRRYRKIATLDDYLSVRPKSMPSVSISTVNTAPDLPWSVTFKHTIGAGDPETIAGELVHHTLSENHPDTTTLSDYQALNKEHEYDVAISFAGPERSIAERLASIVRDAGYSVFYDNFYPDHLWGQDLPTFFDEVYREKSRFCVLFISQEYANRMWTSWERQSATTRLLQERGKDYVLPIKVEHIEISGIPSTIGYLSLDQYSIDDIAQILLKKLHRTHQLDETHRGVLPSNSARGVKPRAASRYTIQAKKVLDYLVSKHDPEEYVGYETIAVGTDLRDQALDDALAELKDHFVIKPVPEASNPFSMIQPRAHAWLQVDREELDFDVHDDILRVAQAVNEQSQLDGPTITQLTNLSPRRVNIAVLTLESRRQVDVLRVMGTAPYLFAEATANHRTRQYLRNQGK